MKALPRVAVVAFVSAVACVSVVAVVPDPSLAGSAPAPPGDAQEERLRSRHQQHEEHHDRVHEFEDAAAWAERFNDPERDAWQKPAQVIELMGIQPGMTVADIGTGTGYFLPHLAGAVGETGTVLALDVSDEMIAWVRTEMLPDIPGDNVQARVVAPDDPALPDASVDRILIVNTWHHIADRPGYAAGLLHDLKPGGSVTIVDFTKEAEDGPPVEARLEPDKVVRELESGGLSAEIVVEELPRQYVVVGRKPPTRWSTASSGSTPAIPTSTGSPSSNLVIRCLRRRDSDPTASP